MCLPRLSWPLIGRVLFSGNISTCHLTDLWSTFLSAGTYSDLQVLILCNSDYLPEMVFQFFFLMLHVLNGKNQITQFLKKNFFKELVLSDIKNANLKLFWCMRYISVTEQKQPPNDVEIQNIITRCISDQWRKDF